MLAKTSRWRCCGWLGSSGNRVTRTTRSDNDSKSMPQCGHEKRSSGWWAKGGGGAARARRAASPVLPPPSTTPPQHLGDQQASELAAAFWPNPAVAAAKCSCQLLIVAGVAIRSHCYRNSEYSEQIVRAMSAEFKPKAWKNQLKGLFGHRPAASPAPSATPSTSMLRLCPAS